MTGSDEWAARLIADLDATQQDVVRLATLISNAVRIEPHLIRRLRLELLRSIDVGVEADLWFSPMVESRGSDAIVFGNAVVKQLWLRLANHPQRDNAIALTHAAHATSAPALLLEEELNALALTRGHSALSEIDRKLAPAVAALRAGEARALEIARWMSRARARLHDVVLASEQMKILLAASALVLRRTGLIGDVALIAEHFAGASSLLPSDMLAKTVTVGVKFDGERLEFTSAGEGSHTIDVPDTVPRLISVQWGENGGARERVIEAVAGRSVPLGGVQRTLTLTSLLGDRYELSFDEPAQCFISYCRLHRQLAAVVAAAIEQRHGVGSVWWQRAAEERTQSDSDARAALELASAVIVLWPPSDSGAWGQIYQDAVSAIRSNRLINVLDVPNASAVPVLFKAHPIAELSRTESILRAIDAVIHRASDVEGGTQGREQAMSTETAKKKCFVVMGFGEKTDYYSNPQRVLNLNRTYEDIIEPAVTSSGLECIRADKIIHTTVIDKPMYELLFEADLVIADLSTANANAIYELGIRHALRPHGTIVMAEEKFAFPFDINHLSLLKYTHMGKELGFQEVLRMRDVLQKAIAQRLSTPEIDSPVFLFLPQLARGATTVGGAAAAALPLAAQPAAAAGDSVATILEAVREAKREATRPQNWRTVVALLQRLEKLQPNDPYVVQQLALATYKAQVPDVLSALREARAIVARLNPDNSSDAETIGLAATIHKRLWNQVQDREDLDAAIRLYMRGYVIKNDYYNGINSAFMLDTRASFSQGDESLADRVIARRLRREVIALCDALLVQQADTLTQDDRFWIQATKVEALSALGRLEEAMSVRASLGRAEGWMITSLESQLEAVARLNSLHESSPGASA